VSKALFRILPFCFLTLTTGPSLAGDKPAFSHSYAVAHYSCKTYGSVRNINVYSQVFAACYQETSHLKVAQNHLRSADQAAQAACAGTTTFQSLSVGFPYQGSSQAESSANRDRDGAIRDEIRHGNMTTSFVVVAPYSAKCQ
jgi:hypothetical protein